MVCEYDQSYDCSSGYDAVRGECCSMKEQKIRSIIVWVSVFLAIFCIALCCALVHRRRVRRQALEYAYFRNIQLNKTKGANH